MKRLLKGFLIMLFFVNMAIANTGTNPGFAIKASYGKAFVLFHESAGLTDFEIRLKGTDGQLIFEEDVKKTSNFARKYNLENVSEGAYFLLIENEQMLRIQPITIKKNKLDIDQTLLKVIYKPHYNFDGDYVDMTMLNSDGNVVKLVLENNYGEELLSETISGKGSLQKRYDVTRLKTGYYTFWVKIDDFAFDHTIEIR